MIVIINGPLGIGKTEVSWQLISHFDSAVMLDGDFLGAVHPFEIYDQGRIEHLYKTISHMMIYQIEHGGYRNFVVNYVFETSDSLVYLRRLLTDLDDVTYSFRLLCEDSEAEQRIRKRAQSQSIDEEMLSWQLYRYRKLTTIQNKAAMHGDMGFPIDTTHLNAKQVAQMIWDNITEEVSIVPYQDVWVKYFELEKQGLQTALGSIALEIHHIGSTAVTGLSAKPVIDIMVVVDHLDVAVDCIALLDQLGYTFIDYPQNTSRRFFRKGVPRTHHLHIVEKGDAEHIDHLDFRDALRSNPAWREAYEHLKFDLAEQYKNDRATYSEKKSDFVASVLSDYRAAV